MQKLNPYGTWRFICNTCLNWVSWWPWGGIDCFFWFGFTLKLKCFFVNIQSYFPLNLQQQSQLPLANATQQESEDLMTSIDLMTFTPSPPEDLNNDATENDFRDLALVESDDNESEDDAQESNYVCTHHMFSRILNFLVVIF